MDQPGAEEERKARFLLVVRFLMRFSQVPARISASLIGHMCLRANKCPDMADYYMWIGELNPSLILANFHLSQQNFDNYKTNSIIKLIRV